MRNKQAMSWRSVQFQVLVLGLCFWAAVASFSGFYSKSKFFEGIDPRRDFAVMIDGTAARPFVYRQLLPVVANWADRLTPQSLKDHLLAHRNYRGQNPYEDYFNSPAALDPHYSFRYLALYLESFLAAWIATLAMYRVGRSEGLDRLASLAAAVLLILLIPYFMVTGGGNFYDYSELAFLALAVWMARSFAWVWLAPLAALAVWNKESFLLFMPALYPLIRSRSSRKSSLVAMAVLGATGAAVYLLVHQQFRNNPGGTVENHLAEQLNFFAHPAHLIADFGKAYNIPTPNSFSLLPIALAVWIVWSNWKSLSLEIRRHAMIAAAINIPLFLLFCDPAETRNLSMLFMCLLLCFGLTFQVGASRFSTRPMSPDEAAESGKELSAR